MKNFNPIAVLSSLIVFLILISFKIFPESTFNTLSWVKNTFVLNISWFYIAVIFCLFCCCIYLIFSPYAKKRLGSLSQPKYNNFTWISMLFSAGMGTGLLFSGVYEPLHHYLFPPTGAGSTPEAMDLSFQLTFLHWGFSGWVVYTIMGLVFAHFSLYKGYPFRISCMLYPFLKEKINSPLAWCIDIFSIIAILFGVAVTLGRGTIQINSGLKHLFDIPFSGTIQAIIIVVITICATLSVLSGIQRGIRRLSEINTVLCLILLVFMFTVGSTIYLFNSFVEYTGAYLQNLIADMTRINSLGSSEWRSQWTILYWAWWIAWSPFVGTFIARISEGRTVREFIIGTLMIPSLISILWFVAFGGTAIEQHMTGVMNLEPFVQTEYSILVFKFLEHFPFAQIMSFITLIAVILFFITSSDSASYIVHNLASTKPKVSRKIYWACLEGVVALVVLFLGGIKSLELLVIITAFPFTIFVCIIVYGFFKELRKLPR